MPGVALHTTSELLAELLGHFHVFEHDLEALRELTTALFLQLEDEGRFGLLADLFLLEQALGKAADVEAFENVLVEEVAEDVDDFV